MDNLFAFRAEDAKSSMMKQAPYISGIVVRRKLPGTITFIITETSAKLAVKSGGLFILTDQSGKVLELTAKKPDGTILLESVPVTSGEIGGNHRL